MLGEERQLLSGGDIVPSISDGVRLARSLLVYNQSQRMQLVYGFMTKIAPDSLEVKV